LVKVIYLLDLLVVEHSVLFLVFFEFIEFDFMQVFVHFLQLLFIIVFELFDLLNVTIVRVFVAHNELLHLSSYLVLLYLDLFSTGLLNPLQLLF
jgi:hypothetical protein